MKRRSINYPNHLNNSRKRSSNHSINHRILPKEIQFNPKEYIKPGLTVQDIIDIKEVFDDFDLNQDGFLSPLELRAAMARFNIKVDKKVIFEIIGQYDEDENGFLDFGSFVKIAITEKPKDSKRMLIRVFNNYDRDKKGYITKEDIKKISNRCREETSDEEIFQIMENYGSLLEGEKEKILKKEDFMEAMQE